MLFPVTKVRLRTEEEIEACLTNGKNKKRKRVEKKEVNAPKRQKVSLQDAFDRVWKNDESELKNKYDAEMASLLAEEGAAKAKVKAAKEAIESRASQEVIPDDVYNRLSDEGKRLVKCAEEESWNAKRKVLEMKVQELQGAVKQSEDARQRRKKRQEEEGEVRKHLHKWIQYYIPLIHEQMEFAEQ